jgi:putative transposase
VIYRLIAQWQQKAEVKRMCRLLDVSRSGFYAARQRQQLPPKLCADSVHLKAAFAASGGNYGSRRLRVVLNNQGRCIGRYRVRSLMKRHSLKPRWRRKFMHTTDSRHGLPVASNLLGRRFNPAAADQAWACDITYIRTRTGWLYLAAVLDLFSRKIVGWAIAQTMPAELVCTALQMAITLRSPAPGLIVHSDRGSQYASDIHSALLATHGLIPSMSRKGNCWDNAVMERFFLNLKMERVWQRSYANATEAIDDITDYIVGFYNTVRLHSTLGYRSPRDFEQHLQAVA